MLSTVTHLPTNSSLMPGRTATATLAAGPAPVTKPPCPTLSSTTNRTAPPQPGVPPGCTRSPSSVASQCLAAIALLGTLLAVFVASTVVLCARLSSSRKYSLDRQRGTEMVCLSAKMTSHSDANGRHVNQEGRQTLLMGPEDSDDDGGDNLTLNSFLPEGDRMV